MTNFDGVLPSDTNRFVSDTESEGSIEIFSPPAPRSCCGFQRHKCWSSKLQSIVFLLAWFFLIYYSMAVFGAWGFFLHFTHKEFTYSNPLVYLCSSVSIRLIITFPLLVASITRKNAWILVYIFGNVLSLGAFIAGTVFLGPKVWICTVLPISSDVGIVYILKQFLNENHLFPMVLAEKMRRFNHAVHTNANAPDHGDHAGSATSLLRNESIVSGDLSDGSVSQKLKITK